MNIEAEAREILAAQGIPLDRVVDAKWDVTIRRMWSSGWGIYEALTPQSARDREVAQRYEVTAMVEILGRHPGARLIPTIESEPRSILELQGIGAWIYAGDEEKHPEVEAP